MNRAHRAPGLAAVYDHAIGKIIQQCLIDRKLGHPIDGPDVRLPTKPRKELRKLAHPLDPGSARRRKGGRNHDNMSARLEIWVFGNDGHR